jgi:hypothetical protein
MTVVPGDRLTFGLWMRTNVLPLVVVMAIVLGGLALLALLGLR